ncbi:MAG TPA: thioesterase family protein [Anaeromyxobacter sp.]|nr:thioesterase family protein [Anaeromyxobacter sp.]
MPYKQSFVVRWSECDQNGHLRNTAYSEYGIETRIGFLADRGFSVRRLRELGIGPVILREELDYLREVHLAEEIEVDFQRLGLSPDGARWRLAHDLRRRGEPVARIVLLGGWLDLEKRRLTPPFPEIQGLFESLEAGEPYQDLAPLKRNASRAASGDGH